MMATTVDFPILVKVDEIHQKLLAHAAHETGRVPTHPKTSSRCKHSNVAAVDVTCALRKERKKVLFSHIHHLAPIKQQFSHLYMEHLYQHLSNISD